MISKKQRREYAIIVGALFIAGMLIYGFLGAPLNSFIISALMGGSLLGGLASGVIFFSRYMRRSNSTFLKVLSCVLLPITLLIILIVGVYPLIPYYIYNLVMLIRMRKYPEKQSVSIQNQGGLLLQKPRRSPLIALVVLCFIFLLGTVQYVINCINDANIANAIYVQTGYPAGTPDSIIIRKYYYKGNNVDYTSLNYSYRIINNVLFVLAENKNQYNTDIIFPDHSGKYSDTGKTMRSAFFTGKYMRPDIDDLFSAENLIYSSNEYAYMLIIDARTDEEHINEYLEGINSSSFDEKTKEDFNNQFFIQSELDHVDRTYAQPDRIQLFNNTGEPISYLEMDNGKYVVFFDSFLSDDKDYNVTVSYEGKEYILLTYDDITGFKIGS